MVCTFKDPYGRILGDGSGDSPGRVLITGYTSSMRRDDIRYLEAHGLPADQGSAYFDARPPVDQGAIAWELIEDLHHQWPTQLRGGIIQGTVSRDRSYPAGKNVGEAIAQLADVSGGIDFEVLPLDPTLNTGYLGEFTVYASQGQDRPGLVWGYGEDTLSNVSSVERRWLPPINRSYMETPEGLTSNILNTVSRGKYGEWAASRSPGEGVGNAFTLSAQAESVIHPEWVRVVKFTGDSLQGPQP